MPSENEENNSEIEKLKKYYEEELARKDEEIKEVRDESSVIMKSALKQSAKLNELTEEMQKILEINKALTNNLKQKSKS